MEPGVVQSWSDEDAWGVIASAATPGGCWVNFVAIEMDGYKCLVVGDDVLFEFDRARQDGYDYRATVVRPPGWSASRITATEEQNHGAYRSTLRITMDDGTVLDGAAARAAVDGPDGSG